MLIDSHCHLDHADFDGEVDALVARARDAGVAALLSISTTLAGFPRLLAIAERYPDVFCTVGVHPHEAAAEAGVSVESLVRLAAHPKVVGIGECGLDFYYNRSPQDIQIDVFRTHIRAARESRLPLVVHTRDADAAMASILAEEQAAGRFTGLLHCFSSGPQLAETAVDLGLDISFSGILTFKNSEPLRVIARRLPAERLLVETDAPYLAPVPMRGKRNEPAYVAHTLAALAACRGEPVAAMAAQTSANFRRLFAKAALPAAD
ncbi:MAG TPA: TatD family hydrolase [Rhodospirillales bacterium]|nr:TatD family hydrolase [Rhodospirillales bacterium]